MNVGYARLSKDDDKRNYVSIENQKLIISQAAAEMGIALDRFYEDDGFSGYKFNRPGFMKMMDDLEPGSHTIFIKDLSRLGRNNGKVLSLLDDFKEQGIRLIAIDDDYDTTGSEDDIIGIKTWYNERYVKDASKKIRRVLSARQKDGTLPVQVPFGYVRDDKDKQSVLVIREEADLVRMIYSLYVKGFGYRKISSYLTERHEPTPSMVRHNRELAKGRVLKHPVSEKWSDGMVKDILGNDFYIGTYRLHKRERAAIHGSDRRVPKADQYVWEDHHEAIIDRATFELVQELREKRSRMNYRGSHLEAADVGEDGSSSSGQSMRACHAWKKSKIPNPFGSCLLCKDCGSKLTPIVRKSQHPDQSKVRKYYICSTYNTKGRNYCRKSHLIEEQDLLQDVLAYIRLCRNALAEVIATYDLKDFEAEKHSAEEKRRHTEALIAAEKSGLKALLMQKVKDTAANPAEADFINDSYKELQQDILVRLKGYEKQLQELNETQQDAPTVRKKRTNALEVADEIIADSDIDRRDVEILIDKIIVDENGLPEITLKYGLSGIVSYSPAEELNRRENEIICQVMRIVYEDERGFTSAKCILERLAKVGIHKSKKAVLPYINLLTEEKIIEPSGDRLKPYTLIISKKELRDWIETYTRENSLDEINESYSQPPNSPQNEPEYPQTLHSSMPGRRYARNGF